MNRIAIISQAFDGTKFYGENHAEECAKYEKPFKEAINKELEGNVGIVKLPDNKIVIKFKTDDDHMLELVNQWLAINHYYAGCEEDYVPITIPKESVIVDEWLILYPVKKNKYNIHTTMETMIKNIQKQIDILNGK